MFLFYFSIIYHTDFYIFPQIIQIFEEQSELIEKAVNGRKKNHSTSHEEEEEKEERKPDSDASKFLFD